MKARIVLSLALLGGCVTGADIETDTDGEEALASGDRAAAADEPLFDQIFKPECGNGEVSSPVAQQLELRWLATSCSGSNELVFRVQGQEVVRTIAGSPCTCMPGIRSVRFTDPSVLTMISGAVDFEVAAPGATLLAWAEVSVLDQYGEHVFTVFDQDGPSGSAGHEENLCAAGSIEDGGGKVRVEFGEQCDDGNNIDGDGCSATCRKEF